MAERMRHQALTAGFVQCSLAAFDDDDFEPGTCRVECGCQARRTSPGHEEVDHVRFARAVFSVLIRVRSRAAFATVKTSAVSHAACTSGSARPSTTTAT